MSHGVESCSCWQCRAEKAEARIADLERMNAGWTEELVAVKHELRASTERVSQLETKYDELLKAGELLRLLLQPGEDGWELTGARKFRDAAGYALRCAVDNLKATRQGANENGTSNSDGSGVRSPDASPAVASGSDDVRPTVQVDAPFSKEAENYVADVYPCEPPCDSYGICSNCHEKLCFGAGYNLGYRAAKATAQGDSEK